MYVWDGMDVGIIITVLCTVLYVVGKIEGKKERRVRRDRFASEGLEGDRRGEGVVVMYVPEDQMKS
jgi:hypothetical protein